MKRWVVLFALFIKIQYIYNRMIPKDLVTMSHLFKDSNKESDPVLVTQDDFNAHEKVIGLKSYDEKDAEGYSYEMERRQVHGTIKKPCAVIVLSNIQNPNMQSLLRKYRYDAKGILIPSSVQYFMKMPQGLSASPVLVPLNDKAFSPLGGFVRYYKEVPPIPQSWKR